ncbi:MAG: aspartate dehydrogenase [Oscillospiraceae bacterium]|nr:aspartate dehydrogenase [Oscillospiraceae bacterium]
MSLFSFKSPKKTSSPPFDPAEEEPAIRCSICTGEQVAGFRNKRSGQFREVTLIRTPKDLESFKKDYGVEDLKKIF